MVFKIIKINKGAMFGLDARIALAIFGALSVISGAALFSAIKNAKVTALITELEEIGKAYDQYYFDTGSVPEISQADRFINTDKLILKPTPAVNNWKGPYLPYSDYPGSSTHVMKHPRYNMVYIAEMENVGGADQIICAGTNPCYIWSGINSVPIDLIIEVDKLIDGGDGKNDGNIRYSQNSTELAEGHAHIFYLYRIKV